MKEQKPYWWEGEPEERFWMEAVARPEFGTRLLAPYGRGRDGTDMPFHATVDKVRDGDVVLHWVTGAHHRIQGFVGYSIVSGLPFETESVPYEAADPLPGRAALLWEFTELPETFTRADLHDRREQIFALKSSLADTVRAERRTLETSLLFPFDPYGQGREIRVHQGAYLSKFPSSLFDVLPELAPARSALGVQGQFSTAAETAGHLIVETRLDRRRAREAGDLGDANVRHAVELRALQQARSHLEADGSHVTDVGSSRPYDLLVTPADGGVDRRVIVRGSTERVSAIELSSATVDDIQRGPTDLVLVHGIECLREGQTIVTDDGDLDIRRGWYPSFSSLVPVQYRHDLS